MLLALIGRRHFCLVLEVLALGLIMGLAIGKAEFISEKVGNGFSG